MNAVAQEAVAWPHKASELEAAAIYLDEVDDDETESVRRVAAFLRAVAAHPSPSPEQGEDDLAATLQDFWRSAKMEDRVNEASVLLRAATEIYALRANLERTESARACWRRVAERLETEKQSAEADNVALRARVAELEARATPPAGASEAEPVAWMRDYPDMTCLTTTKPEPPEPGWRDIWMPLYATPPDSDAVREALHSSVCLLETMAETAKDVGDIANWSLMSVMAEQGRAALSNQGSSSNGEEPQR